MNWRDEKGQSMVETALLLPVLILVLVGIFDFGRIFYTYSHLHLAAQESVRIGGLGGDDVEMINFTKNYVNVVDSSQLQISITPDDTMRDSGDYVTVVLQYPMDFMTPFVSSMLPSPFMVETESTIRVE